MGAHHWRQSDIAAALGIERSHWSRVWAGVRPVRPVLGRLRELTGLAGAEDLP